MLSRIRQGIRARLERRPCHEDPVVAPQAPDRLPAITRRSHLVYHPQAT